MSERLHKLLAQHGLGSRREIEKWIAAGRVALNGRAAQLGDRFTPGDRVAVDGKDVTARLVATGGPRVALYHKAQGQPVAPSVAAEGAELTEKSVFESLPAPRGVRWLVVNTMQPADSGLLLVTTDGALANALRRKAESTPATYLARVLVPFPEFDVSTIPRFVQYDEETVEFATIEPAGGEGTNRWIKVEAPRAHRRAAVKALFESRGLKVSRVIQTRFGTLELPRDLPRGKHRELSEREIAALYEYAGLAVPREPRSEQRRPAARRRPAPDRRKKKKRL